MSNGYLVSSVTDELFWDPKVNSSEISVSARGGHVTLRGTVRTLREARAAKNAAERVLGVSTVESMLKVELTYHSKRPDPDLRNDILEALALNSLIPGTVDVRVEDGVVSLVGAVEWQCQRDEAERVVVNIVGVIGLRNEIMLTGAPPDGADVKRAIENALARDARLDAEDFTVEAANGTIILKGVVDSWSEHDAAIAAAWAARGVRKVDDRILVGR